MKKHNRILLLSISAVSIVSISVFGYYGFGMSKVEDSRVGINTPRKPTAESAHSPHSSISSRDFIYPMDDTRDPFQQRPTGVDVQRPTSFNDKRSVIVLTGIIWEEENPIAILTDSENASHIVRVGEEVDQAKVVAVRPRSITIEEAGRMRQLDLWPAELQHDLELGNLNGAHKDRHAVIPGKAMSQLADDTQSIRGTQ